MKAPPIPAVHYRPDIDGLRAIAILGVVVFHYFPSWLPGGFAGVDVFFVISGYLITGILLRDDQEKSLSIGGFYSRRIRRIFPALTLVFASTLAAGLGWLDSDELQRLGREITGGAFFVSNFILWAEAGYFDVASETKPLLHLWSLAIEEQFYTVWPLLMVWCLRRGWLLWMTLLIIVGSLATNGYLSLNDPTADFYAPWSRAWELLFGAGLAILLAEKAQRRSSESLRTTHLKSSTIASIKKRWLITSDSALFPPWVSLLGFTLIFASFVWHDETKAYPGVLGLLPVLGATFLVGAGESAPVNRQLLSRSLFRFVGLISYPLYLWHWPLLSFGRILSGDTPPPEIRLFLLLASVLLSIATYYFVERPFRRKGRESLKVAVLSLGVISFGLVGAVLGDFIHKDGKRSDAPATRYSSNGIRLAEGRPCEDFTMAVGEATCLKFGAGSRRLVVWGDSHGMQLGRYLPEQLLEDDTSITVIWQPGCPPLASVVRADKMINAFNCMDPSVLARYADYIAAQKPEAIVLVGRWTLYLRGWHRLGKPEPTTHFLALDTEDPGSLSGSRQAFLAGLKSDFSRFKESKVFVLGQPPDLCLLNERKRKTADKISRSEVDAWHQVEDEIFKDPTLSPFDYLDLRSRLCDQVTCRLRLRGSALYLDDNHLLDNGVMIEWDLIEKAWRTTH
jgi:peptidoglycan/LPS O-acetylase OafA/YrhL